MSLDNAKNFSKVTVSLGYNDTDLSIILTSGDGLKLPTAPFNAVWYNSTDYNDPSDDPNKEIIRVTVIVTDTLTITRAQEGTIAANHNTGGKVYKLIAGLTAKVINDDIAPNVHASHSDDQTADEVSTEDSGISVQDALNNLEGNSHIPHSDDQTASEISTTESGVSVQDKLDSMASFPVAQSQITGLVNDLKNLALNIMLNAFRLIIQGSLTLQNMVDSFIDEYEDETGIDTVNSINQVYDSSNDLYSPLIPIDNNVKLLLHCDGDDGSQTFIDDSFYNHTINPQGNAQLDTAQKKFGTASGLLDGNDYLTSPDSDDWDFGTGDFTVECQTMFNALPGAGAQITFISHYGGTGENGIWTFTMENNGGILTLTSYIFDGGFRNVGNHVVTLSTGVFYHFAMVRVSGTIYFFCAGILVGSASCPWNLTHAGSLVLGIGGQSNGSRCINGWIDEVLVNKGTGKWTSNFTPPIADYTPIPQDMTLLSQTKTADAVPSNSRLVIFEEDVDSVTLNTDLKGWISRDGGSTFSQVTLVEESLYDAPARILSGEVDISGQPSGTDMRYKITTIAKDLKIHGCGLLWK